MKKFYITSFWSIFNNIIYNFSLYIKREIVNFLSLTNYLFDFKVPVPYQITENYRFAVLREIFSPSKSIKLVDTSKWNKFFLYFILLDNSINYFFWSELDEAFWPTSNLYLWYKETSPNRPPLQKIAVCSICIFFCEIIFTFITTKIENDFKN